MAANSETRPSPIQIPDSVEGLKAIGYLDVNPLFNVAEDNPDHITRYDLIHPKTEERILWTPPSSPTSMELVEFAIGDREHPVFFPLLKRDHEGDEYHLPNNVRPLFKTFESRPFVEEYMARLEQDAKEFLGKLALLDPRSFGIDTKDILINHTTKSEEVFFSILPPLLDPADKNFSDTIEFKQRKRLEVEKYIKELQ